MQDNMNLCPCCGEDNWEQTSQVTFRITLDRYTGAVSTREELPEFEGPIVCCGCGCNLGDE
jgi:hypothetical protein